MRAKGKVQWFSSPCLFVLWNWDMWSVGPWWSFRGKSTMRWWWCMSRNWMLGGYNNKLDGHERENRSNWIVGFNLFSSSSAKWWMDIVQCLYVEEEASKCYTARGRKVRDSAWPTKYIRKITCLWKIEIEFNGSALERDLLKLKGIRFILCKPHELRTEIANQLVCPLEFKLSSGMAMGLRSWEHLNIIQAFCFNFQLLRDLNEGHRRRLLVILKEFIWDEHYLVGDFLRNYADCYTHNMCFPFGCTPLGKYRIIGKEE